VVAIQVGYCCSDVISKCGVGFIIYGITSAKSRQDQEEGLLSPYKNRPSAGGSGLTDPGCSAM